MTKEIYVVRASEIDAMEGLAKAHFLNPRARRINKSLGDLTGLSGLGFHIIEVAPGDVSTEHHVHFFEEECVYVLAGEGVAVIGETREPVGPGDFIGYRKGGAAHSIENEGQEVLRMIVVGQRLDHDVADYPRQNKRIYRNPGQPWAVVDAEDIFEPKGAGKK